MPTTVRPAGHSATIPAWRPAAKDATDLLKSVARDDCKTLIQSSFQNLQDRPPIHPLEHGFVITAIRAYNEHLHLVIRPEDVWFSILTQLSIYVNEHSEELRGSFVSHEGQKELAIVDKGGLNEYDFGDMATRMASLIQENLVDPDIRAWIQPSFTTTTDDDVTVASIIMMGALKKYFKYKFYIMCGLPSVTLLGDRKDWVDILQRLERLPGLGEEPARWYRLLVPVVTKFIQSFDAPEDSDTIEFWQKIAHWSSGGSGPTYLSGWITAFCFWNEDGRCMCPNEPGFDSPSFTHWIDMDSETPRLFLSGVAYHRIDSDEIAKGHVSVPVKVNDNGLEYEAVMIAGCIGMQVTSSGEPGLPEMQKQGSLSKRDDNEGAGSQSGVPLIGLDTVQPVTGWFIHGTIPKRS